MDVEVLRDHIPGGDVFGCRILTIYDRTWLPRWWSHPCGSYEAPALCFNSLTREHRQESRSLKVRGEMSVSFDNYKIKCSANNVNYNHNKLSLSDAPPPSR